MSRAQRRRVFIDSTVQGALALRIILHWACFLIVASVAALVLQVLSNPFRPLSNHFRDLWRTQGPFLFVMAILLPVFVSDIIRFSHRFFGPVFSLRRAIRDVADGKPPRILNFRTGEYWQELAHDFNALLVHAGFVQQDRVSAVLDQSESFDEYPVGLTNSSH